MITQNGDEDVKKWEVSCIAANRQESNLTVAGKVEDVDIAVWLLGVYSREHFTPVQKDVHLAKLLKKKKQLSCSLCIETN